MSLPPLLEVESVSKRFGNVQALTSISLSLLPGRVYGLAGENGAGKSTFVKILCGIHPQHDGRMRFEGQPYRPRTSAEAEQAGIRVFHQEIPICPNLSVAANVFLGPELPGKQSFPDWARLENQCANLFRDLLGIQIDAQRPLGLCTIAERQLALLVRVLYREAKLIILDEPTTALTPPEVERLFQIIRRLAAQGISFIFVSHFLDQLLELSDELFVLRDGALVGHGQRGEFDARKLAELIAGRQVATPAADATNGEAACTLEVQNLCRAGEFSNVSFQLRKGEVLGLTGLQGSGRSAVVKAVFGAPPSTSGCVFRNGKRVAIRKVPDAIRNGVGYVPEDRRSLGLFDGLDVQSNLGLLRLDSMTHLGLLNFKRLTDLALQMQRKLQIKFSAPASSIASLSGGNQQKVLIGRWLAVDPEVLLMNEPTRGVDIGAKDEICRLVRKLAAEGRSFLVSSADLDELMRIADRILVMRTGRIAAEFSRAEFRKEDLVHAASATVP